MKQKLGSSLNNANIYVPGPGNYEATLKTKKDSPKYGFGSSTRDGGMNKKLNVPGPGSYLVKSFIGDVPDYAMPGRRPD